MLSTNILQRSPATGPVGVLALPGADWPMLTCLLLARRHYRDAQALADDLDVDESVVDRWQDAELFPRELHAARLLDRAYQFLLPDDLVLAGVRGPTPYWFRSMPDGDVSRSFQTSSLRP